MKILVVGGSGFVGRALVERLMLDGHEVEAWDRKGGSAAPGVQRYSVDLLGPALLPTPRGMPWDAAYHLAAHALPGAVWNRALVLENLAMASRMLEHLALHAPGCVVFLASSGQVYAPSDQPHVETAPLGPLRPYGLSKQLCEDWALSMRERLCVQIVRAFNQIGPGMARGLLIPDLLERLSVPGTQLSMSGRDDWKDFLDWRDAMDAYAHLLRQPGPSGSVWNLCSGRATRVSSLIRQILDERGDRREIRFADPAVETLIGHPGKLMQATGWAPRRTLLETVRTICAAPASPIT